MGRGGIEPPTLGLRVAHLQGICRSYWLLILVSAGCWRSELLSSGHGWGHAFMSDEQAAFSSVLVESHHPGLSERHAVRR